MRFDILQVAPKDTEAVTQVQSIFNDIFPEAYFPLEQFLAEVQGETEFIKTLLVVALLSDQPIGFRLMRYATNSEVAFVSYGGVIPEFQSQGVYPWIAETSDTILRTDLEVKTLLTECENPWESQFDHLENALKRLRFFRKQGFRFLESFPWVIPGFDETDPHFKCALVDNYLLGVKRLQTPNELRSFRLPVSKIKYLYQMLLKLDYRIDSDEQLTEFAAFQFMQRIFERSAKRNLVLR